MLALYLLKFLHNLTQSYFPIEAQNLRTGLPNIYTHLNLLCMSVFSCPIGDWIANANPTGCWPAGINCEL